MNGGFIMEDKKVQELVKECVQLIDSSETYEQGLNRVCEKYDIPYEEIFIPKSARVNLDDVGQTSDELLDTLTFANNQSAVVELFTGLQQSINKINTDLVSSSIASSTGVVNQNPQLHGFIFEEIHAAVFNMRARMAGKPYIALVLKPRPGQTYAKNSVDILIVNSNTHEKLQQYQLKCCATSDATIQAISNGDYRNQRLLVADGQAADVKKAFPGKTVTTHLEYDGISSNPLTHAKAKELQNAIQSGRWDAINWNEYSTNDLFYAGLESLKTPVLIDVIMRTVVGVGVKVTGHTDESWSEVFKRIGIGVLDDTSKLALTTAAQIVIKKELVDTVVGNLTASQIYAVVSLAVDTVKEIVKVAEGKQDINQAVDHVAKKAVVAAAQLAGGAGGATLGGLTGGPIGAKIGLVIGSTTCGLLADKAYDYVESKIEEFTSENNENKVKVPLHEKLSEKNLALN